MTGRQDAEKFEWATDLAYENWRRYEDYREEQIAWLAKYLNLPRPGLWSPDPTPASDLIEAKWRELGIIPPEAPRGLWGPVTGEPGSPFVEFVRRMDLFQRWARSIVPGFRIQGPRG